MQTNLEQGAYEAIRRLARDYDWIHTGVGIAGNLMFFIGSILFLFEPAKVVGIWLFILGSFGMLVGSVGRAIVKDVWGS